MMDLDPALRIGGKVRPDVLHHVWQNHVDPQMLKACKTFLSSKDEELPARPVLSHLFPILWAMVPRGDVPAPELGQSSGARTAAAMSADDTEDLSVDILREGDDGVCSGDAADADDQKVFFGDVASGAMPRRSGSEAAPSMHRSAVSEAGAVSEAAPDSCQSLAAAHEDRSLLRDRGALDFAFRSRLLQTSDWVCKLLLDAKDMNIGKTNHWTDVVVWQLLAYANYHALDNSKKSKVGILHLAAMQIGVFTHAQLHVYGMLEVVNGGISDASFASYKAQEASYLEQMMQRAPYSFWDLCKRDKADLLKALSDAQDEITERSADCRVLDGCYMVGDVSIEDNSVMWERFVNVCPSGVVESMFVMDYLLETLIGRKTRAWQWTPTTMEAMV